MSKLLNLILGGVLVLYPIGVFYGIQNFGPRLICVFLLALLALRHVLLRDNTGPARLGSGALAGLLGGLFCVLVFVANRGEWLKFYPVLMNFFMLCLFALSLKHGPPIIERLARLQQPNLSPRGVLHATQATVAWCGFFLLNGSIALYTALYQSMEIWTLYNGLLSYLGMGLMFAIEYPIRRARMAQDRREAHEPSS